MPRLKVFIITGVIYLITIPAYAQFTSQQAINLVLNQILSAELDQVDVYMIETVESDQDTIFLGNNDTIMLPYSSNWVFFVDDNPFANWAHNCRFIFVDEANGNYQIMNNDFFPEDWTISYSCISEMQRPTTEDLPININANIIGLDPNPNLYAVIICSDEYLRFWNDISAIYCTLLDVYGYTKENIFVHYMDGTSIDWGDDLDDPSDPSDDIDYDAHKSTILHTFSELAGETNTSIEIPKLNPMDGLFIFIDGHGYNSSKDDHSYLQLPGDDIMDSIFAEALKGINCSQIIAIIEPCYMGGFEDELSNYIDFNVSCKNRSIQTASDNEPSRAEVWITSNKFNEFVFYWTAAARGHYPDELFPWQTTYVTGDFPFYNYPRLVGHPNDFDPDSNGDGFVQMQEAFYYANFMDTWSAEGYYYPHSTGGGPHEVPQEFTDISFTDDLLTLCGVAGKVTTTQTAENRNYLIGGNLAVNSPASLTLEQSGTFYLGNENASININNSAGLIIEDDVIFFGVNDNSIIVDGNIQTGQRVAFNNLGTTNGLNGLILNNSSMQTVLNRATFNESYLRNYGADLNISNAEFNNCEWIQSFNGNITVNNCDFTDTWLYLENQQDNPNLTVRILNSTFDNPSVYTGIDVTNYDNYLISNNNINALYNGVQLINSGNDNYVTQDISNNTIYNCGWSGVLAYNTKGAFYNNHIHDNETGIKLMNKCNMALSGNSMATTNFETNFITNNSSHEVYTSKYSFPWYFRYNVIIDEDNMGNPTDPLLYFNQQTSGEINPKDIKYNCWGNNFVASEDLYPPTFYNWSPTWCPGSSSALLEPAQQMYIDGTEQFEAQLYPEAKATFMLLIETYPETEYAMSAMKELVNVEKYVSNDYMALKSYYQSNDSIQADTILQELSVSLVNDCEIKLENWPTAISYYEGIISNPVSLEDSVFAIIDLGYVYFLMGNSSNKSTFTGDLKQYIPESKEKFFEHRDYLLSLLPGKKSDNSYKDIFHEVTGELVLNAPNPFSKKTRIWYRLKEESSIQIYVYNASGQMLKTIKEGIKGEGDHYVDIEANGMENGIYFYSISLNGITTDTRKMTILK